MMAWHQVVSINMGAYLFFSVALNLDILHHINIIDLVPPHSTSFPGWRPKATQISIMAKYCHAQQIV
jgi:hypothetical protein